MTAIFAYVDDDVAFIAADTLRADHDLKVFPDAKVTKVHHRWSEHILLAQTGYGQAMTDLLLDMTAIRDNTYNGQKDLNTFDGLENVFKIRQPIKLAEAKKKPHMKNVNGTIVAACASEAGSPAQIVTFNFVSGKKLIVGQSGRIYADGTDQAALTGIAAKHFPGCKSADGQIALDKWAIACLGEAIQQFPTSIGWPVDLAIARSYPVPTRLTILRRLQSAAEPLNPAFTVPG